MDCHRLFAYAVQFQNRIAVRTTFINKIYVLSEPDE